MKLLEVMLKYDGHTLTTGEMHKHCHSVGGTYWGGTESYKHETIEKSTDIYVATTEAGNSQPHSHNAH